MTYLLIAFIFSFTIPILISSWRVGVVGLALQTLILAAVIFFSSENHSLSMWIQLADLIIVRSLVVPLIFISVLKKQDLNSEFDFVPANFIYWLGFSILVTLSLWFGHLMFRENFQLGLQCGAAAAGILTSFLVLGLQPAGLGQMFGILLLESSIILIEFLSSHYQNLFIQLGISVLFFAQILVMRIFLKRLGTLSATDLSEETRDII